VEEFATTLPSSSTLPAGAIDKLDRGAAECWSALRIKWQDSRRGSTRSRALREGTKVIYTTPLKALSNQKYHDFVLEYGERPSAWSQVRTHHPDAPVS